MTAEDGGAPGFVVHRLVQDFARRAMSEERHAQALREALEWVNAAFVGDPHDVRNWPILDPLAPHALAVARHADEAEIAEPTARLLAMLGDLFDVKAGYAEAEPLYAPRAGDRREELGPDHPDVATDLINLASFLRATNRLAEAEPLCAARSRSTSTSTGQTTPRSRRDLGNLAKLFGRQRVLRRGRELLIRRALDDRRERAMDQTIPDVAIGLHNLLVYSGHEKVRRGRTPEPPRASDRREELWVQITQKSRLALKVSQDVSTKRTAQARQNHYVTSVSDRRGSLWA